MDPLNTKIGLKDQNSSEAANRKNSKQRGASRFFRPLLNATTDLIGASTLAAWGLILGPLAMLRGTLKLRHMGWYILVLSPRGLLSHLVQGVIDWRLGHFDATVFQLEFICSRVELYLKENPDYRHAHTVLEDFYTLLARSYLHGGHLEEAMLVILRAKANLKIDKLPALSRLNVNQAQLVRAGIAAGKLLESGGLATLFVKPSGEPSVRHTPPPSIPLNKSPHQTPLRQGASSKSPSHLGPTLKKPPVSSPKKMGQLIPFKRPPHQDSPRMIDPTL
jgi:hypothetical protein